jgi:hypothetical protein
MFNEEDLKEIKISTPTKKRKSINKDKISGKVITHLIIF